MQRLYSAPLRVYILLFGLALAGLYSGLSLPVSLFPNSSKPHISVYLTYGSSTAEEFLAAYGSTLEEQLRTVATRNLQVEQVRANYSRNSAYYDIDFAWGNSDLDALREVQTLINGFAARFPLEIRNSVEVWSSNGSSGFLSVSFSSQKRSLDELYDLLEPILAPQLARVPDAASAELYNPAHKDIQVEIQPEKMASLGLLPKDLSRAIEEGLTSYSGGTFTSQAHTYTIQMPRALQTLEDVRRVPVQAPGGVGIHLGDVAKIDYAVRPEGTRSYKTNGAPSIILWAEPKAGANVKRMSDDILHIVEKNRALIPEDVQYKVIVNPSEFIRSAVQNVMREVAIGGLLSVLILFLFLGSLRNTLTAAIEIPLAMLLAFIPMKLLGMNLNLISLAGLALSAGMNVDASVVVMENIFRRFEEVKEKELLSWEQKLATVLSAVSEIRFSVIASTVSSLVVFLPLAFTSALTNAILGDLAKTVVFSHGFSALVALVLVPTVRLHLMSRPGGMRPNHSPFEAKFKKLEDAYARTLSSFLQRPKLQHGTYLGLAVALGLLLLLVFPRLPREVIGTPDTDWIRIRITATGNARIRQMEQLTDEIEAQLLGKFSEHILYTYIRVPEPNSAVVMGRLKDKSEMRALWKEFEATFLNTPFLKFRVDSWNPADLPIPDPAQLKIALQGGALEDRANAAAEISMLLEEKNILPRLWTEPEVGHVDMIVLRPNLDRWTALGAADANISPGDLADIVRVATSGKPSSIEIPLNGKMARIFLRYPDFYVKNPEDVGSLPVGIRGKLVPLRGLTGVSVEEAKPTIYREDGREMFHVYGRKNASSEGAHFDPAYLQQAEAALKEWQAGAQAKMKPGHAAPVALFERADGELVDALSQLGFAMLLSIFLIFATLLLQFGSVMNALIVMVAIPLGFIGVLSSLFVFGSTLSLNSVLGVILLNGIAVANSIILVDFQGKLVADGMAPLEAAIEAGRKRLRPILITSLTTTLAMLPVALGLGEGGRILQPLGIAVAGGFWVSMGFTLFVVPALKTAYLTRKT